MKLKWWVSGGEWKLVLKCYQVEWALMGVARGNHTCKSLREGCSQEEPGNIMRVTLNKSPVIATSKQDQWDLKKKSQLTAHGHDVCSRCVRNWCRLWYFLEQCFACWPCWCHTSGGGSVPHWIWLLTFCHAPSFFQKAISTGTDLTTRSSEMQPPGYSVKQTLSMAPTISPPMWTHPHSGQKSCTLIILHKAWPCNRNRKFV